MECHGWWPSPPEDLRLDVPLILYSGWPYVRNAPVAPKGSGDVVIPDTWVMGRAAVEAFGSWCTSRKWIFQPIEGSSDFGKDGYVEVSRAGSPTGEMFCVQVKGGASWRAAGGHRIPVGKHLRIWKDSTVPVVGIIFDKGLRWVNLTTALTEDPECSSVFVSDAARLDADGQIEALLESMRSSVHPGLPMTLGSISVDDQGSAVWDCFALARRNAEALIALRRSFLAMDDRASRSAAVVLSLCTPHPDVLWTRDNWLPPAIQRTVCDSMRWSVPEVWRLLALVGPEGGFSRGSFGQYVYMLLVEHPDCVDLMRQTAMAAASEDPDVTLWAVLLLLHLSGRRGPEEWSALLAARPEIANIPLATEFAETLHADGYVSAW